MEKLGEQSPRKRQKREGEALDSSKSVEDSAVSINAIIVPPQGPKEKEDKPGNVCPLLDLPDHLIEFIMLKQDARGQARSKSPCRSMREIGKDPFFHSQRDKLAPQVEPVHSFVYLPKMISDGHPPQAWDAERRTWLRLPSLSFLPRGTFIEESQPNTLTCTAPGLLFLDYILQPTECTQLDLLCVCNPLTQQAIFVPLPPSRVRGTHDARTPFGFTAFGFFYAWPSFPHILLHRGPVGRGFTLYDLSGAPSVLFKLPVAPAVDGMVPLGNGMLLSTAQWTAHRRPLPNGQNFPLIRYARSVVVDRVIRTLCSRRVADDQFQAVFVDFNMDKEEWEQEVEVGSVPYPDAESDDESDSSDSSDEDPEDESDSSDLDEGDYDTALVRVGENGELWLLHNHRKGNEESDSEEEEDEECEEQASSSTGSSSSSSSPLLESGERKRRVDLYVYKAQANKFVRVDTIWIQVTHTVAQGGVWSSTICFVSSPDRPIITYDVVTKRLSLGPPVGDTIPTSNYSLWPGAANFQLNPAPWI